MLTEPLDQRAYFSFADRFVRVVAGLMLQLSCSTGFVRARLRDVVVTGACIGPLLFRTGIRTTVPPVSLPTGRRQGLGYRELKGKAERLN